MPEDDISCSVSVTDDEGEVPPTVPQERSPIVSDIEWNVDFTQYGNFYVNEMTCSSTAADADGERSQRATSGQSERLPIVVQPYPRFFDCQSR